MSDTRHHSPAHSTTKPRQPAHRRLCQLKANGLLGPSLRKGDAIVAAAAAGDKDPSVLNREGALFQKLDQCRRRLLGIKPLQESTCKSGVCRYVSVC